MWERKKEKRKIFKRKMKTTREKFNKREKLGFREKKKSNFSAAAAA